MAILSKDLVLVEIAKRLNELYEKRALLVDALKNVPDGNLRIAKKGKKFQYYHVTEKSDSKGRYLSLKDENDREIIKRIAQRDYNKKVLKQIESDIRSLEKTSINYKPFKIEKSYTDLKEGRKVFVSPVCMADEEYFEKWQSVRYVGKEFQENEIFFVTARGEKVRSKAEMIIADTLNKFNVPYHFEFPFNLKTLGKIYTNFICLSRRTGREYIWEHFGMMDDSQQSAKSVARLQAFQSCGMFPGEKLIITMESSNKPLTEELVERIVYKYLL